MCGIIGKAGVENVVPQLLRGLSKLEYRGYDSSGIAVFNKGNLTCCKTAGRIYKLKKSVEDNNLQSLTGIGHTRWATHGAPTAENAHPHRSADGKFTIVHNGIIENAESLKKSYLKGVSFTSGTDTEVAVQLMAKFYDGDIINTISRVCNMLEGAFALGIMCCDYPHTIFACAVSSPLLAVTDNTGNFITSDICAVESDNANIYKISQGEICKITSATIDFYNKRGELIAKTPHKQKYLCSEVDKGGYEHFMLKEIYQQSSAVRDTVEAFVCKNSISFRDFILSEDFIKNSLKEVVIVACGSAYHAGLTGKICIESFCKLPCRVEYASEYRYSNQFVAENTLLVFISQSGETADTLAALRLALNKNCKAVAIVNVKGSAIAEECGSVIYTLAGKEVAVATTKAYSAQLAVLYALAVYMGALRETVAQCDVERYLQEMCLLPTKISDTIHKTADKMKEISAKIYRSKSIFFIGRQIDYACAAEGALKMREISYINAPGFPAGELKHGSIALIDTDTPVVAVAIDKGTVDKTISNIYEVQARGAHIIVITTQELKEKFSDFSDVVTVPATVNEFQNSLSVLPLQLLSYYTAKLLGCDIDKPKNLAKSVTVE